ncbi:MAG: hypothetical protein GX787_05180 [Tissierellia bacterium]|nr:hypothetical protein [Tissierellia bacterium]
MLKDVLREINNARVFSLSKIGASLNISEAMVDELVGQLVRMGYLIEDMGSPTCETKCSGCFVSSCNTIPLKMYSVSTKGKALLNN